MQTRRSMIIAIWSVVASNVVVAPEIKFHGRKDLEYLPPGFYALDEFLNGPRIGYTFDFEMYVSNRYQLMARIRQVSELPFGYGKDWAWNRKSDGLAVVLVYSPEITKRVRQARKDEIKGVKVDSSGIRYKEI